MKKVIKKTASSRKPVEPPRGFIKSSIAKKPMMRSGGAKKSLRKYQGDEGGSEIGPTPSGSTAKAAPAKSFSDYYKDNLAAGLPERKARKIAMVEAGVKDPKHRVDPNAVINAVGNTAGAIGQAAQAFRPQPSGPMGPMKKGGTMKKRLPKAGPGKIIKAVATGIKKAGKTIKNELTPDKGGYNPFKKKTPIKTAAKIGTLGAGYLLGAKALLDRDAKKQQLLQKKKTAKPSKPKQLGPQSFAKGGTSKMAMKKTMVKTKKK